MEGRNWQNLINIGEVEDVVSRQDREFWRGYWCGSKKGLLDSPC